MRAQSPRLRGVRMTREYLAAHGVQAALASAVCEVLRSRPADPILGIRDILLAKEAAKTKAMMDAPPAKEPMKLAAQSCFEVSFDVRDRTERLPTALTHCPPARRCRTSYDSHSSRAGASLPPLRLPVARECGDMRSA